MLLECRTTYKPFQYGWAYRSYELQQSMHWLPTTISLDEDVKDWKSNLDPAEKHLLTQLFRFFTQADLDIAGAYIDTYMPMFKPPEVRMMLTSFAAMEGIHMQAYSYLLDTVGMPEVEYSAFMEYSEMKEKHDYLESIKVDNSPFRLALALAVFSAFGEGLQLFSSFAMLLNFPRFGLMKGMGQIVTYSMKDEDLHVRSMIRVFKTFLQEYEEHIDIEALNIRINQACETMVDLEDKFIDLAYELGSIRGLESSDVKQFIRFIANKRLEQLGLSPLYRVEKNPLPWLDWVMSATEHASFFELDATDYSKGQLQGTWEDVWKQ